MSSIADALKRAQQERDRNRGQQEAVEERSPKREPSLAAVVLRRNMPTRPAAVEPSVPTIALAPSIPPSPPVIESPVAESLVAPPRIESPSNTDSLDNLDSVATEPANIAEPLANNQTAELTT